MPDARLNPNRRRLAALWLITLPALRPGLPGAAAALAAAPVRAAGVENPIAGVRFEPRVQLAGEALQLNGTGLRAVAWLKGYAAALYLPQPAASAEAALAQPGAKRLQMRLLLDVPVAEFVKAFHKGMDRNSAPAQHTGLAERMGRFDALLQPLGTVRKGDQVNLDWVPGQGLLCWHNGRQLGTAIAGDDFYAALLRIFIGERPVDEALKAGLLGRRA